LSPADLRYWTDHVAESAGLSPSDSSDSGFYDPSTNFERTSSSFMGKDCGNSESSVAEGQQTVGLGRSRPEKGSQSCFAYRQSGEKSLIVSELGPPLSFPEL